MPAAKVTTAAKKVADPNEETLEKIAAIVRRPEAAEHGGRNRYKREAIESIKALTADVVVGEAIEEAVIEVPGELDETPDPDPEAA